MAPAPASKAPKRVLGYCRVSSRDQAKGNSLAEQWSGIEVHAKAMRFPAPARYVEHESAVREKAERRAELQRLIRDVRAGDLVLCAKLDRWSRDPEFTYKSIREIKEAGARIYFIDEDIDASTPKGEHELDTRIMFAKWEHARIKERTVGNRKGLRDQGFYVEGLPPYGLRRARPKGFRGPTEKNQLIIEEKEAATVRRMFALCIAGLSHAKVSAEVGLTEDHVKAALSNRLYIGQLQSSAGEWITSKYIPAIVTPDIFHKAQEAIANRRCGPAPGQGEDSTKPWLLRDVATCGLCGSRCATAFGGDPAKRIPYYRCGKREGNRLTGCRRGGYVSQRKTETEAVPMVLARLVELKEELSREPKRQAASKGPDFDAQRVRLRAKRARIVDAYGEGDISKEDFRARVESIDADLARVDANEAAANVKRNPLESKEVRRAVLREIETLARAWAAATPEARREIARHLATAVKLVRGEAPVFVWRTAEELAEAAS